MAIGFVYSVLLPTTLTMTTTCFTLFDTPIGQCGIAWSPRGVVAIQLPESTEQRLRARLIRGFPVAQEAPATAAIQAAIDDIVALLGGQSSDLRGIELDTAGVPTFNQRVYEIARTIPPGSTLTYGEIAARLGEPRDARAVGQALGQNPFPLVVPCHRVVAAGGKLGGFSAPGGTRTKVRLLAIEAASHQLMLEFTPD
jgi:methylated-DNA-[protein]-cysteine S-methyltransferase